MITLLIKLIATLTTLNALLHPTSLRGKDPDPIYFVHVEKGVVTNFLIDPDNIIPTGKLGDPSEWIATTSSHSVGEQYDGALFTKTPSMKPMIFVSSTST